MIPTPTLPREASRQTLLPLWPSLLPAAYYVAVEKLADWGVGAKTLKDRNTPIGKG